MRLSIGMSLGGRSGGGGGGALPPEAVYLPAAAGTPLVAIGARRLVAAYAGPLFRVQRASDNAQMDISQLAHGGPDDASAIAWAAGAEMRLALIYDQAGGGRN